MSYTNCADNLEYYYDGANVDDGSDIDMEDDLLQLLGDAKKHSEEEEEEEDTNNNNVGRDWRRRRGRRLWKKYLVSWCRKCSEEEEDANKRKRKRKRMGSYNEVQVLGCCWGTVTGVVFGRALRNSRAVVEMNYKYNDGTGASGSPPPPYHRHHMMKLDVDGNGGLSSSSYYGPIYLVT